MKPSRFSTVARVTKQLSAIFFGGAILAACGVGYPIGAEHAKPLVMIDAEKDLDCPPKEITVTEEWGGVWKAVGCGRVQKYNSNCSGVRCEVHRDDEAPVPVQDRPTE